MCSKCKEKNDRRLARRKERLEGIARFNQAVKNNDEEGIDEHMRWCAVESDYDELSEYAPDEHEVMEMMNADNERRERESYEELSDEMFDDKEKWTRCGPTVASLSGWSGLTASYIAWTRGSSLALPGSCRSTWA